MPVPLLIVEGYKYDFSVVAAIVAMKFGFHMPTYRQQDWFAQCGWFPSRSTVNDLINYGADTIGPLHQQMWLCWASDSVEQAGKLRRKPPCPAARQSFLYDRY
jgi:hypothetical protein